MCPCGREVRRVERRNTRHLTLYGTMRVVGRYLIAVCDCGSTVATWTRRELTPRSAANG